VWAGTGSVDGEEVGGRAGDVPQRRVGRRWRGCDGPILPDQEVTEPFPLGSASEDEDLDDVDELGGPVGQERIRRRTFQLFS
jgi:hypothetical protein